MRVTVKFQMSYKVKHEINFNSLLRKCLQRYKKHLIIWRKMLSLVDKKR